MNELGNVNISQEVVATIAELVVSEIEGVSSLVGGKSKNEIIKFFQSVSAGGKGIDVEVGETVRITSGAFEDKLGVITELNPEKGTLKLSVEMFNRDTEVEVEFSQVEKAL